MGSDGEKQRRKHLRHRISEEKERFGNTKAALLASSKSAPAPMTDSELHVGESIPEKTSPSTCSESSKDSDRQCRAASSTPELLFFQFVIGGTECEDSSNRSYGSQEGEAEGIEASSVFSSNLLHGMIIQQMMALATQASPVKALFELEELETGALSIIQHLVMEASLQHKMESLDDENTRLKRKQQFQLTRSGTTEMISKESDGVIIPLEAAPICGVSAKVQKRAP